MSRDKNEQDMKLISKEKKPEAFTIAALKELLKKAEEGELVGIVYAALHEDGLCSYGKVGLLDLQPNRMAGAIANAQLQYQLNHVLEWQPFEE